MKAQSKVPSTQRTGISIRYAVIKIHCNYSHQELEHNIGADIVSQTNTLKYIDYIIVYLPQNKYKV